MAFARIILSIALLIVPALGNSTGAPKAACVDMIPQHQVSPQASVAPYTVQTSKSKLQGGESVDITLKGNSPTDTIKGFMVQARVDNKPVGQFKISPSNQFGQAVSCDNLGDTLTHKKIEGDGPNSLTFTWIPPNGLKGEVSFRATIALNGGVFWVGKLSSPVLLS